MKALIIILLLLPNYLFADDKIYTEYTSNENYRLYIRLFDNNQFIIECSNLTIDIPIDYQISIGRYSIIRDTIIFKDELFDYEYKGTITNEVILNNIRLKIISGIDYLEGREFDYKEMYEWSPEKALTFINLLRKQKKQNMKSIDSLKSEICQYSISSGVYTNLIRSNNKWHDIKRFKLEINNNQKYKFYIQEDYLLFSKGNWEQINHLLVLKDEKTNAEFKLEITDKNQLKSLIIPASIGGMSNYKFRLNQNKE